MRATSAGAEGEGQMRLSGARPPVQDQTPGALKEAELRERPDERRGGFTVERPSWRIAVARARPHLNAETGPFRSGTRRN